MAKYKVKHTSIMHNKQVYAEGSEIELNEEQAKRLGDFLTPVQETKASAGGGSSEKADKTADKTPKAKTKTTKSTAKSKTAKQGTEPEKDPAKDGETKDIETDSEKDLIAEGAE